jgi:hypothetical protein
MTAVNLAAAVEIVKPVADAPAAHVPVVVPAVPVPIVAGKPLTP